MNTSAVAGIFFDQNGNILTIKNSRGTDIPGGHTENGETVKQTIIREAREEAGAIIDNVQLIKKIQAKNGVYLGKSMVFVMGKVISFDKRKANLMTTTDFLKVYSQNKLLMKILLQKAKKDYEGK